MAIRHELAAWLESLPHISNVRPCQIRIARTTYECATYTQHCTVSPGCKAYDRGEREYYREVVYCVGMLPASVRRGNAVFRIAGDDKQLDWYVSCYMGDVHARKQAIALPTEYNPFGNSFCLDCWNVPDGGTIDRYARVPYKRVTIYPVAEES